MTPTTSISSLINVFKSDMWMLLNNNHIDSIIGHESWTTYTTKTHIASVLSKHSIFIDVDFNIKSNYSHNVLIYFYLYVISYM